MPSNRAARRLLMALAIVAGVQDGVAEAARLVGVDERRDRIVEIDTATGSVDTVVAGDDVRADQIVWSPDESFAYLLAGQRDEILVFDPATERITERIAVEAPTHVVFHPTEARAYVQGCGVVVLDTGTHRVVDSFDAWPADYLVLSRSGRWLYGVGESSSFWMRDLWLSVSYDGSWWDFDPTWSWEHIGGAAAAYSSDALVLAAEGSVWTFDPESHDLRRFPYRGAGMAFAMAPQSDVAVIVSHSDLVRIDLITGATVVQPLDELLWANWRWGYGSQVFFSDDASVVFMFQNESLAARDTASLALLWQAPLSVGNAGLVKGDGPHVLVFPRERWDRWPTATAHLVREGSLTAQVEPARWSDAAWRSADRSFYAVGDEGLERIDPDTAARQPLLADLRLGDIALAGETAFSVARGDGTVRSARLRSGVLSEPIATVDPWHAEGAPLAVDPAGERVYAVNGTGLTAYEAATGEMVDHLAADDVGLDRWGPVTSLAILEDGIAVLGHGSYGEDRAVAVVVDITAHQVVAAHRLANYGTDMWVVREPSGTVALAATAENTYDEDSVYPVVARISRDGLLQQWLGEPGTGVVVALAPGAVEGVAFVATANERIRLPPNLLTIDVAAGELVVEHQLGGRLKALISDGATVYAALDAEPSLLLFDALEAELLGGLKVDVRLTQLEIADGDAGMHGGLSDVQLPSPSPPPGMIVAASGEEGDITVWFDGQRTTHFVGGSSYEGKIAFGPGGVLYAGVLSYERHSFLIVLDPLSGVVSAEIALDGVSGNILPTPDGELVFVETRFSSGSGLSVIDAATHQLIHELRPRGNWLEPAMTPDGAFIVARAGDALAVLDTRSAAVTFYPLEVPAVAVATTDAGAHYLGEDGHLYGVDLASGETRVGGKLVVAKRRGELAGGSSALLAYGEGLCGGELVRADAVGGGVLDTLMPDGGLSYLSVAAAGDYAQTGYASQVDIWDLRDGNLASRLVRPEGFDRSNLVLSIATACIDDCPPPPIAPDRVRWDLLPSATPTLTPTPSATPTPDPDPPVEQPDVWLEVDTVAGVAGDIVDIAIHHDSRYGESRKVTGFQLDLWLPADVRPQEWRAGQPDCEFIGDRDHIAASYPWYRSASVFLPEGCDPAVDCRGFRVLAAAETELEVWPWIVCRARIDAELPPGSYPMSVDNLYLVTEPQSDRLQAVVGDVYVLDDRRAATPTPDPVDYYGPTPAPIPPLLLQGRGVETTAGWTNNVEFVLSGGAIAPVRGDLRVIVEMEPPLRPAPNGLGGVRCRRNPELSKGGTFELLPPGCGATGDCTGVAAWIKIDPGFTGFDSGDPPRWFFRPDDWLFRCEIAVDEDAENGQYYVLLNEATFDERPVTASDILIDAFVPRFTPTATATPPATWTQTPTRTPRPHQSPRPCTAEAGTSIICIDDLEADAGDAVALNVHYLSSGLEQAGLAFEIDLGKAFVPVVEGNGTISDNSDPCRVNPEIDKNGSAFAYFGEQIKALILSFDNLDPLPDDVRLVTCTLDVTSDLAPGEYEIALLEPGGSDPDGNELPVATRNGYLRIRGTVAPTTTSTPLPETPTATSEPTQTPQANTRDIEAVSDDSGCQVVEPRINGWAAALLVLVPPMLWLRRRRSADQPLDPRPSPLAPADVRGGAPYIR